MKFKISLLTLALLIVSCSNSVSDCSRDEDVASDEVLFEKDIDGFVRILASGKKTILGTKDVVAKANEKPEMNVWFSYDFSIGESEVTCGEFKSVMETEGVQMDLDCSSNSLPVTNVSYFDAVVFANAKSRQQGRDTVYSYSAVEFSESGHCVGLDGLKFNTDAEGFRLPTEAEWIFVAAQGWDAEKSWNSQNSNMEKHETCKKGLNKVNVCDMAGNVMEWVNDGLGKFKDTTLVNYVGGPDGGGNAERVVKGGSYRTNPLTMNYYSRGDVYMVTSSTRAEYVGFRLAFGKIPNPVWMNSEGQASESLISIVTNAAKIKGITGTYKSKLAFRNDLTGNLAFVDYSTGGSKVIEIEDSLEVYHPDISPDGKRVAFCTGMEGVDGKSAVYVRDLNAAGSNLVKLDVPSAAIPRWRVVDGDTVVVFVTGAGNNSELAAFQKQSTWQVSFANGAFGVPRKLFDGAYHGGVSADNRLAVTGARLLRARVADSARTLVESSRDTVWYANEQACNASLDVYGKRTLFLDFGGKTGKQFVGKDYGVHERLLIADSTGTLVQSVAAPAGYSFDHCEWLLNGGLSGIAVATLANVNGAHSKIVLINLSDSSVTPVLEGEELWHPCLWKSGEQISGIESFLDSDSAGVYLLPDDSWGMTMLRYKMEMLWKYRDTANVAIVGSSRPLYAVSPSYFSEEFFAVNFSQTPNSIYMSRDYFVNYIYPHLKNLKYLVVSLDLDFWFKTGEGETDNVFANEYVRYPGYLYDKNHNYWQDGYPEGLLEYTESALQTEERAEFIDDRGCWTRTICLAWGDFAEVEFDSTFLDREPGYLENSFNALVDIVKKASAKNIYVVGAIFPQSPLYSATGAFGRYGMRRSTAENVIARLELLSSEYPNFVLFDENKMGYHDYSSEMAVDPDHLCGTGAIQFTSRLNSLLKTLE